jgi:hypothetical protein
MCFPPALIDRMLQKTLKLFMLIIVNALINQDGQLEINPSILAAQK